MTKDEALEYIYKQQNIFAKYNLNRDITDIVIPLLNDIAKVVSKIEPDKELVDMVCDLMIAMLNDGTIETRDIGMVNTIIRKVMSKK